MKILEFGGYLGIGGTEKATCRWAAGLKQRGHDVIVLAMKLGPRKEELELAGIPIISCAWNLAAVANAVTEIKPDVIHMHASGSPFAGDVVGEALLTLPKIPLVQTNIFGRLENPKEDAWTDFRLFISWTSCVQAARRACRKLDDNFFRRASVAVYPLDPLEPPPAAATAVFRRQCGVAQDEVLFGRISRPDPGKWSDLALDAFRLAARNHPKIKMLLREPPPLVAAALRRSPDAGRFVILPATSDTNELRLTLAALDVVLHTAINGESFGYGIAEPMNLGKPVITHSVPWQDQAQIELARHGECGFVASTPAAMAAHICHLAEDPDLRQRLGQQAQTHIRQLADPAVSLDRLEAMLHAALANRDNPFAAEDLIRARRTAAYLDAHQFGHSWSEQFALRPLHYRVRFHDWRKAFHSSK